MKRRFFFAMCVLGWTMILLVLMMGVVYGVAADDGLYFYLQNQAKILDSAGISREDLRELDERLSAYLFKPMHADMAFDNRQIEVFGSLQPPFNERELAHLHDCRKLLSITTPNALHVLLIAAGGTLAWVGGKKNRRAGMRAVLLASALILAPIAVLGIWAALDFESAFAFFHELLFANDLWLLNPETDLLIRICPASMFAGMGLRIAVRAALEILGLPLLVYLLFRGEKWLNKRKKERKKQNEWAEI